jgi:hypothetical protein
MNNTISPIVPTLSLMRKNNPAAFLRWKLDHKIGPDDPFCLHFRDGVHEIYYIASDHTDDETSKTFELIDKLGPLARVIVVEGASGENPSLEKGEGAHAIKIARNHDIPTYGVETPANLYCKMIANEFATEDIYGWVFLMLARQSFDVGRSESEMWQDYSLYSPWYHAFLQKIEFSPLKWFKSAYGKEYKYGKFLDHSSPKPGKQITRQIAREIAAVRDPTILANLYNIVNLYNSACYVVGMSHTYRDLPVLLNTFGQYEVTAAEVPKSGG